MLIQNLLFIIPGLIIGGVIHEIIHFLTARRWTEEVEIDFLNLPPHTDFNQPYDFSLRNMRIVSIGPTLFGTAPTLIYIYLWWIVGIDFGLLSYVLFGIFIGTSAPSLSDIAGTVSPAEFREYCSNNQVAPTRKESLSMIF